MEHVKYMEKTRNYYSQEYKNPYQWAHFDEVPFTPLKKPLSESCVTLVSTGDVVIKSDFETMVDPVEEGKVDGVYSIPTDTPPELLASRSHSYDEYATHLNDVNTFFPVTRLLEAAESGRIRSVSTRLHVAHNSYSQRKTREIDAPEILKRCQEDGVDVAFLVPL